MLKKFGFAVIALVLFTANSYAGDDLLAEIASLDSASITDASASIEGMNLDNLDVDALASTAGSQNDEAIEACFRRVNYCGYNYGCYNNYYSCYRPCYTPVHYTCYRPVHYVTYRPVHYTCYTPVHYSTCYTSYWGCY